MDPLPYTPTACLSHVSLFGGYKLVSHMYHLHLHNLHAPREISLSSIVAASYIYVDVNVFKKSFGVVLAVLINAPETMTTSTPFNMQNASAVGRLCILLSLSLSLPSCCTEEVEIQWSLVMEKINKISFSIKS